MFCGARYCCCFSAFLFRCSQPFEPHKPIDTDSVYFLAERVQALQGSFFFILSCAWRSVAHSFHDAGHISEAQKKLEQIYASKLAEIRERQRRKDIFANELLEEPELVEVSHNADESKAVTPSITPRLSPSIDANMTSD
jgi:hypothetical protein